MGLKRVRLAAVALTFASASALAAAPPLDDWEPCDCSHMNQAITHKYNQCVAEELGWPCANVTNCRMNLQTSQITFDGWCSDDPDCPNGCFPSEEC